MEMGASKLHGYLPETRQKSLASAPSAMKERGRRVEIIPLYSIRVRAQGECPFSSEGGGTSSRDYTTVLNGISKPLCSNLATAGGLGPPPLRGLRLYTIFYTPRPPALWLARHRGPPPPFRVGRG